MNKSTEKLLHEGDLSDTTTYQAGVVQAAVNRLLQKQCDEALKPYGISKAQWLLIGTILDAGESGVRVTDLAVTLDTTLPYLTNTLNILESKGMVGRLDNAGDSRSKLLTIPAAFIPRCREIEQTLRQALRDSIYSQVDPAEFRVYMKVMYQLAGIR